MDAKFKEILDGLPSKRGRAHAWNLTTNSSVNFGAEVGRTVTLLTFLVRSVRSK